MSILGRDRSRSEDEMVAGGDAATRALSSTVVENAFVEQVYHYGNFAGLGIGS